MVNGIFDCIIIGSGPAGYTAAIYNSRANIKTLLVEGPQVGGQLTITSEVENFPGWPEAILGMDLMQNIRRQAEKFGAEIKSGIVREVDFKSQPFIVKTDSEVYRGKTVIIATGASAKWLGLPEEIKLRGRGISGCATCDGFFSKGKEVVVVGGGDTAMEEANFVTRFARKVYLIHRRQEFRASKIMAERVRANPKVEFILDTAVEEILGKDKVEGVKLKNVNTGETRELKCEMVFVAIGHHPNIDFLGGQLELDDKGYIKVVPNSTRTNIPGVFAAGDVADPHYRQAIVAAGRGCMAAKEVEWHLAKLK